MTDERKSGGAAADWPLYQGTKQLRANPCGKAAYCEIRGWAVPADEDPEEPGYIVEYADGGKPNVDGYDGYISWSPADVFLQSYRPCGSHVDRMRIELQELGDRLQKLTTFIMEPDGVYSACPIMRRRFSMPSMARCSLTRAS
jgi:hypothetical protein